MLNTKKSFESLVKQCIAEVITESPKQNKADKMVSNISQAERNKLHDSLKKRGVDGNGRFDKKEHGLREVSNALDECGFILDMVSADIIMGDKGSRMLPFRRKNDEGADIYSEKPMIENSRLVFNWERLDGPTHQYPNSPHKFEIQTYAS